MNPPGFWRTVRLLLGNAQLRAKGRIRQRRAQRRGGVQFLLLVIFAIALQVMMAILLTEVLVAGERLELHRGGQHVAIATYLAVLRTLPAGHRLSEMLGSLVLIGWAALLVFQGEGASSDVYQRRHPMWEWLFSHPVSPAAVFTAEMLAPLAANPYLFTAPLFPAIVYGLVYGPAYGALALAVVGVPVAVALASLGKAFEIGLMLRVPPRLRGAIFGMIGWFASVAPGVIFIVASRGAGSLIAPLAGLLRRLAPLPWPWLDLFVGRDSDGGHDILRGILVCDLAAAVGFAAAILLCVRSARRGLTAPPAVAVRRSRLPRFGRTAIYRKELLWLARDPGAIVQIVLLPLGLVGVQALQLGMAVTRTRIAWNELAAVAIVYGTTFLTYLGPKSLASEGRALWITLTWPQGLEALLRAKAWLWTMIASALVAVVLIVTAATHPHDAWRIALVAAGWFVFARSMALKASTLATVTSESGEVGKVPNGRRWATYLGTATFAAGVFTEQWNVAVLGVVYSVMTAAAMWQGFRVRLPFLYDPWSEQRPAAPSLVHAMVAISLFVDIGAPLALAVAAAFGADALAPAYTITYSVVAFGVAVGISEFLRKRGVALRDVLTWPGRRVMSLASALPAGIAAGLTLGLLGAFYVALLARIPAAAQVLHGGQRGAPEIPHLRIAIAVMAVGVAPFTEEYLFRGLLYRALDREWGGARAVAGSAIFFAVYHPPLSWLPVAALGAVNAWLFRRTGRLGASIAAHITYNAVITAADFL